MRFSHAYQQFYGSEIILPTLRVDTILDREKISLNTIQTIEALRPF